MESRENGLHYKLHRNILVIYITNDLDHHTVEQWRECSERLIAAGGIKHIIFDFTDVEFMDSSGIGLIMGRYKKIMFLGGKVAVTNVGRVVNRIFTLSGVYKIIDRYDSVEEALQEINKKTQKGVVEKCN